MIIFGNKELFPVARLCPALCDSMDCSTLASLSFTVFWSLLKLMSIESKKSSNHLILCITFKKLKAKALHMLQNYMILLLFNH